MCVVFIPKYVCKSNYCVNVGIFLSNRIMPLAYLWGTCRWPLSSAMMTFPNAERLSDTLSGSLDLEELPRSIRWSRLLPPATTKRKLTFKLFCFNQYIFCYLCFNTVKFVYRCCIMHIWTIPIHVYACAEN